MRINKQSTVATQSAMQSTCLTSNHIMPSRAPLHERLLAFSRTAGELLLSAIATKASAFKSCLRYTADQHSHT